jgi:hypothetical protein
LVQDPECTPDFLANTVGSLLFVLADERAAAIASMSSF